jgi:peptidoglycan/xylan/chitin deacetylase (PgdA/CDA1 family)
MPGQPGCRPARRRPQPRCASRWIALFILLSGLLLAGPIGPRLQASADAPERNPAYVPPSRTVTNRAVCIDPGNDKPCFTLSDLRVRVPKWAIAPPVWVEYPAALDAVPLIARTYAPATVEYLAAHEIRSGDPQSRTFALTFDCENYPDRVTTILDILRHQGVQATFFVQGRFAYLHPEIMRTMVADGHELGNHSFFHPLFNDLTPLEMTREITYTEAAIAWAVGEYVPMRYFRFPYSGRNGYTLRHVAGLGYQSSYWDMDPRGWEPDKTAQDIVDHVRRHAYGGGIVIIHCSSVDDINALPGLLQALRDRGLRPGTLSEVLTPEDRNVPGYQVLPHP